MKKIPTIFERDFESKNKYVINKINPLTQWVFDGEGIATRKFDGTCCLINNGILYKRYDCKKGTNPPEGFIPAQEKDEITGHWPGWVKVKNTNENKYFLEAFISGEFNKKHEDGCAVDGTYELCGPKINGNKEGLLQHILIPHGMEIYKDCPTKYNDIFEWLKSKNIEGIVWHRKNGDMAKIKKRDFGLER